MKNMPKTIQVMMILIITFCLAAPATANNGISQVKAHPLLLQIASEDPEMVVSVIVQKARKEVDLSKDVSNLGGKINKDLHIINAFVAQLTARAAVELARSSNVRWVSLDAPVKSSTTLDKTLLDLFTVKSYNNNDGTTPWSGSWIESGDDGTAGGGSIKVDNGHLQIKDKNRSIYRQANLSQAASAILSMDYRRVDELGTQFVKLEISNDAGSTWYELYRFTGEGKDALMIPIVFDVSNFIAPDVRIRFTTSSSLGAKKIYIDNVQISFTILDAPPAVTILQPTSGTTVLSQTYINVNATDDHAVTQVDFLVDSLSIGTDNDGSNGWSMIWNTTLQVDGSYTLSAVATDSAGQTSIHSIPVYVNNGIAFNYTVEDTLYSFPLDFTNNSGNRNWTSPWLEISEDDGPANGDIRLATVLGLDRIQIQEVANDFDGWNPVGGIWRTTDLSGANNAVLSFVFRRALLESTDYAMIEISNDGGATWFELDRVYGTSNDADFIPRGYNISSFISPSVGLRFITNFTKNSDNDQDILQIDDVRIAFNPPPLPMPANTFLDTLGVRPLWNMGIKGSWVTVAVIDSGMRPDNDFAKLPENPGSAYMRLKTQVSFNDNTNLAYDNFGHGTYVAGVIGGAGQKSGGYYMGIAPNVSFVSLKVCDDYGMAYESDVVEAMQWVYENKNEPAYNIRIVNLSINSTVEQSYHTSPLDAAAEILWFNGVVVVASAGNSYDTLGYNPVNAAPANDPFIITVGASDEHGTADRSDDTVTPWSAYGVTLDGFIKPDIIAPGKDIVATLSWSSWWRNVYLDHFIEGVYFRASGTSVAAPMVTGAVALLLQDEPNLTPDQVKYRLLHTGSLIPGAPEDQNAYPYLDIYSAVTGTTTESANTGLTASQLLWTGPEPITWTSVAWNSVAWNSVAWNSVAWNSVAWNSVAWNSTYFGP